MCENKNKYDLNYVTFLFCIQVETEDDIKNLELILKFLKKYFKTTVIIYEIGMLKKIPSGFHSENIKIYFFQDNYLYKSKYLNRMVHEVETPVVAIWEADSLVPPHQIIESANEILYGKADYSYPNDGMIYEASRQLFEVLIENDEKLDVIKKNEKMLKMGEGITETENVIMLNTQSYKNAGLENENIKSFQLSSLERDKRLEILRLKIHRSKGNLLLIQNIYGHKKRKLYNISKQMDLQELLRVCKMNDVNLKEYIDNWT